MSSSHSSSDSSGESASFEKLHPLVQKWIWKQNWNDLRDIQEASINEILDKKNDIIISAATAQGKTEAAFLPICSILASSESKNSIRVIYVGPLKALINDQFNRLDTLCEDLSIPVTRWHGDVSPSQKKKLLDKPDGILLITPESFESIMVNHGHNIKRIFSELEYVVIDELHAFLGSERGKQLQSLISRLECFIGRSIRKVGLSATLGDMSFAKKYISPDKYDDVRVITSEATEQEILLQLRGRSVMPPVEGEGAEEPTANPSIGRHLFETLRGTSNLIFANSRSNVEQYADFLRRACETSKYPNEFYPHHGNLSKEFREDIEDKLKQRAGPLTVVCTSTLEMGVDIGQVSSIAQVGVPPTVASLRQRLGRSGRRGDPAVMRVYIEEVGLTPDTHLIDTLRPNLFESVAMIQLMLEKWNEPSGSKAMHLSTLIQQTLSVIAGTGGAKADQIFELLCVKGAFRNVSKPRFIELLRNLGSKDIIIQAGDGLLLLGLKGEKIVNHYGFYASFQTPDEYRLVHGGNTIGSMPVTLTYEGMYLIFSGRRWQIKSVSAEEKIIDLKSAQGGAPPKFSSSLGMVANEVRRKMLEVYTGKVIPEYLNKEAKELMNQGFTSFDRFGLQNEKLLQVGKDVVFIVWEGDAIVKTIDLILKLNGHETERYDFFITIKNSAREKLIKEVKNIAGQNAPSLNQLIDLVDDMLQEKYDYLLSANLLREEFGLKNVSLEGALSYLKKISSSMS